MERAALRHTRCVDSFLDIDGYVRVKSFSGRRSGAARLALLALQQLNAYEPHPRHGGGVVGVILPSLKHVLSVYSLPREKQVSVNIT